MLWTIVVDLTNQSSIILAPISQQQPTTPQHSNLFTPHKSGLQTTSRILSSQRLTVQEKAWWVVHMPYYAVWWRLWGQLQFLICPFHNECKSHNLGLDWLSFINKVLHWSAFTGFTHTPNHKKQPTRMTTNPDCTGMCCNIQSIIYHCTFE